MRKPELLILGLRLAAVALSAHVATDMGVAKKSSISFLSR